MAAASTKCLIVLCTLILFAGTASAQFSTFTPSCTGTAGVDTPRFAAIIATIGANEGTIQIPYKADPNARCHLSSLSIPANVTLDNTTGTGIRISTASTLTIVGKIESPAKQLFYNALATQGLVSIVSYGTQKIYPEWWGASPSASAATNTPALQAAITSISNRVNGTANVKYNRVLWFSGNYQINDELRVYHMNGFRWEGQNKFIAGITQTATNKRIVDGISVSYGVFNQLNFSSTAAQGAGIALIDLNYIDPPNPGNQGSDLRPQNISFYDCVFSGNGISLMGVWIARAGGGAQGDNVRFYNCYGNGFTHSTATLGGNNTSPLTNSGYGYNAINVEWKGGDIQGCPLYGLAAYGGNWIISQASFENQTLDGVGFPTQTGYDLWCEAPQLPCAMTDVSSESLRVVGGGGYTILKNVRPRSYPPGSFVWYDSNSGNVMPGALAYVGQLFTGTPYGGNGKLYKTVSVPLAPQEPFEDITAPFPTCPPENPQCATTFTDSANTYVPGAWVGHWVQFIYPNCFGQAPFYYLRTITANDDHTFTLDTPIYAFGDVDPAQACGTHTTYGLFTNTGEPVPRWGGLTLSAATSGSSTTIVKSGAGWGVNVFLGYRASIQAGTAAKQYCVITGNTADTITCAAGWVTDFDHEVLPAFAIANPDNTSQFVVEPNWGTQTTSGTITFELFDYYILDGGSGSYFQGDIDGFHAASGKIKWGGGKIINLTAARQDVFVDSNFMLDGQIVLPQWEHVYIQRLNQSGYGLPWTFPRNNGGTYSTPSSSVKEQGTEWITWTGAATTGGPFTRVGLGRGDDQFSNTTNKDILAIEGKLGKKTARGTNVAGSDITIQPGLPTGNAASGKVLFTMPVGAGGSGATPATPVTTVQIENGRFKPYSVTFANLGTMAAPAIVYCSDCNSASSPCTSGGSGAYAFRTAAATWVCPY